MAVVLYVIGVLTTVAGLFSLGFSIPNRGFDVANALIGAGATATVGGLVLIGIGAAIRELRRLGRTLQEQAATGARAEAAGPARSSRVTGPIPVPARPAPPEHAEETEGGARPSIFAVVRGGGPTEHFEIDEADNVPLSPRGSERAPEPGFAERSPEPRAEPRPDARSASPATIASRTAARLDLPRTVPPEPAAQPATEPAAEKPHRNLFDSVWPNEGRRPGTAPPRQAPARERPLFAPPPEEQEPPPDPFDLNAAVREAVESIVPERRSEAPPEPKPGPRAAPAERRPEPRAEPRPEPRVAARVSEATVTILKSGVIDGMAYTLYTDGSIEAELPDGTMRFASIDDLRAYLERNT